MSQIENYESGMVKLYEPKLNENCEGSFGCACDECSKYHSSGYEGRAFLPHSCSEWIIGDKKQIALLIADLQKFID